VASSNFGFVASGISWSSKIFSGIFSDEGCLKCEGLRRKTAGEIYTMICQWPVARKTMYILSGSSQRGGQKVAFSKRQRDQRDYGRIIS
jgi:hypothetical protein